MSDVSIGASDYFDNDAAATALHDGLLGSAEPADSAAVVLEMARDSNRPNSVSPVILEALTRFALSQDLRARSQASLAMLWLCSATWREWTLLVRSNVLNMIPILLSTLSEVVFASNEVGADMNTSVVLAARLRRLSCTGTFRQNEINITPFSVAIAYVVGDQSYDEDTIRNDSQRIDFTASRESSSLRKLYRAFELFPAACWSAVCDDDFACVVRLLSSAQSSSRTLSVLNSDSFVTRLQALFAGGTIAAGLIYGMLSTLPGPSRAKQIALRAFDALSGYSGFRLGCNELRLAEHDSDVSCSLVQSTDFTEVFAFAESAASLHIRHTVAAVKKWRDSWDSISEPDSSRLKLYATVAYVASPYKVSRILADFSVLDWIDEVPLSFRGPVDIAIESGIAAVLAGIADINTVLVGVGISMQKQRSECGKASSSDGKSHLSGESGCDDVLQLRRAALSHPAIALRHVGLLCGGIFAALRSECPYSLPVTCAVIKLLNILLALRPTVCRGENGVLTWAAAVMSLSIALGEGRACHGVLGEFAEMATVACDLMQGFDASFFGCNDAGTTFIDESDGEILCQLRLATKAPNTENLLCAVAECVLGKFFIN